MLDRIAACEIFVFALSPDSANSHACRCELEYATELRRPVIPVMVRRVAPNLAPGAIPEQHIIDYSERSPESTIALLTALHNTWAAPPVAERPPGPPPPFVDVSGIKRRLASADLTLADQRAVLDELVGLAPDPDQREPVARLVREFLGRPDLAARVRPELEELLDSVSSSRNQDGAGDPQRASRRFDLVRSLLTHVEGGRLTPILGHGINDHLVGSSAEIAQDWAEGFRFPLADHRRTDLADVAQFVSVMTNPETLRSGLGLHIQKRLGGGDGGQGSRTELSAMLREAWLDHAAATDHDVHTTIAELPCTIFVDASPWPLISDALHHVGKSPVIEVCRWREDVDEWPDSVFANEPDYRPSVERPLVFHVFGSLDVPESIVLTEDDYMDFVVAVTADPTLVPSAVMNALSNSALLLLGCELDDWDVRTLFRTVVGGEGSGRLRRYTHVAAQLDPAAAAVISPERARDYLERYFGRFREPAMDIYWGSVRDFVDDLVAARRSGQE